MGQSKINKNVPLNIERTKPYKDSGSSGPMNIIINRLKIYAIPERI